MNRLRQPRWLKLRTLLPIFLCVQVCCILCADEEVVTPKAQPAPASEHSGTIALIGGRVLTMESAGVLEGATVLVTGDIITAIGNDIAIPDDATRIEVRGMTVSPGLIDCRSTLWLASDSISASASDGSLKAIDALDPFSDSWVEVARQGVTTVSVQPSGSLGGLSVVLRVAPASAVSELIVKDGAAMQASIGLSGSTGNSRDRYAQYEAIKKTLDAAKTYKEEWEKYEEAVRKAAEKPATPKAESAKPTEPKKDEATQSKPATDEAKPSSGPPSGGNRRSSGSREGRSGPPGGTPASGSTESASAETSATAGSDDAKDKKAELPKKPKRDPLKDVLVRVLKKELPLRIEVHRSDDVENALRLAKDFDLTFVFEGVSQAGRAWSSLREQHPPLIVGPFANFEPTASYASRDADRYSALKEQEGLVAIATFSRDSRGSRLIRFHAGAAVAAGMNPEQAMRAVTIDAARVLGIDSITGSLQAGRNADVIVVAGDPLDPSARVMLTMSRGEIVYQAHDVKAVNHNTLVDVPELNSDLPKDFALVSDRVLYPDGSMAPGAVLVRAGRIVGLRKDKSKVGRFPPIDMGSAVISPGLIVGHYSEVEFESTDAVTSQIRATDSFSPDSTPLKKLGHAGFTSVAYAPDSRSVVSGQVGCVRILADDQILMKDGEAVLPTSKFVLAGRARSSVRFPASLTGQLQLLDQYLNGDPVSSNLYIPGAVRSLMEAQHAEVLNSLKSKSTVALFEAESSPEIDAALSLIRRHDLKAVVLHPEDLRTSIAALQELKTGLIVRTARIGDYDWYVQDIATASHSGIRVSISGDDAMEIRQTLAMLVNAGMSSEAALRSVTSDAAENLGLSDYGQLTPNSTADIVIWNGSPLNASARPIHVIVDGRLLKDAQ